MFKFVAGVTCGILLTMVVFGGAVISTFDFDAAVEQVQPITVIENTKAVTIPEVPYKSKSDLEQEYLSIYPSFPTNYFIVSEESQIKFLKEKLDYD
jgi:hypothetical protein